MFQQLRTSPSRSTVLPFGGALSLHLATLLLIVLLIWFYIRQVDEARLIPARKKSFWKVFLVLGNVVAFPVCWFITVWRQPHESPE